MADVELKPQVYRDERPEEYFAQFHDRARRQPAGWTYELTRFFVVPYSLLAFRLRAIGTENVPNGPVILAPNHGSFMDHFFTGAHLRRRVRFMAKSQLFSSGPATYIFSHGGVFPVRRGHQDEEAFTTAFRLLDRGEAVVMYCEGGRTRTGELAAQAKPGIGRLALQSGAPVVPIAIQGSHRVRNWKRLEFPNVVVQFGAPFRFERVEEPSRERQQQVSDYILERIRALHSELGRLGYRGAMRAAHAPPPAPPSEEASEHSPAADADPPEPSPAERSTESRPAGDQPERSESARQ
jgi:1-acyl-sn-glycerol-3-phosphate acyltransferase